MLIRHADAAAFLAVARPAFEAEETANNLILGLALRLEARPDSVKQPPYFATASVAGGLAAAGVMTPPYPFVPWSGGLDARAGLAALAADLRRDGWPVPGVAARQPTADQFRDLWTAQTGAPTTFSVHQRIYRLDRVLAPAWPAGGALPAADADAALVAGWMEAFTEEAIGARHGEDWNARARERIGLGDVVLWKVGGEAVAMAARARILPHGAVVSLVYTPPGQRGRGYASAVVAALSQRLLDTGFDYCALYTDLGNPTSNSIYQKLGYRPVADAAEHRFGPPSP